MIFLVGRELFVSSDDVLRDMYTSIYIYIYMIRVLFIGVRIALFKGSLVKLLDAFFWKFSFLVRSNFLFVPTSKRFLRE